VCLCLLRGCVEFRVQSIDRFSVLVFSKGGAGPGRRASKFTDEKKVVLPGYGGTKVITIFLERHKLYEAVSYVYLVRHRQILRAAVKEL
jgi:hypothetical protein